MISDGHILDLMDFDGFEPILDDDWPMIRLEDSSERKHNVVACKNTSRTSKNVHRVAEKPPRTFLNQI